MMENVVKRAENKEGKADNAKRDFDKSLGIKEELHDTVNHLIDEYLESEECINQYNHQIENCKNNLDKFDERIKKLTENLTKAKKQEDRDKIQDEIDKKKAERDSTIKQKKRLEESQYKETDAKNRAEKKFRRLTKGKDIKDGVAAAKTQNKALAGIANIGSMSKALGKLKANPWMIAVDGLIKAIEFGIDKATQYTRLNAENLVRTLNATTTVSLNEMKASLSSWQDAVSGAYEAQELAISSQLAMMEAQNANQLANMKMANTWTNWIPIWGQINKYNETALEMEQKLAETRMSNASKMIAQVNQFTKKTDDYIKKQDKAIHLFQAENGLSASQTGFFEQRMLGQGEAFAKINRTIEDALKMQSNFISQSGRAVNYSNDDYMKTMATGRLVGDDNLVNFQSQMQLFNHSVSDAADIMYDMFKDVNKMGLSQKKVTKDVLANLKLANKYNFKNGTKGFIELAKWAENSRFNLGSLGNMIEKIESDGLEGVITQSAKLQVLGGGFSMNSDPLRMAYLAGNDAEGYAKHVKEMFKGIGKLDKETGETKFNFADSQRIRAAAEALGMSTEDARSMIREDNKKSVVKNQMRHSSLSKPEQEAVANKAQRDAKTGEWYVEKIGGGRINVGDVQSGDIQNILSADNDEASVQYAKSTMSLVDKIESTTKQIDAKLGALTFANFQQLSEQEMNSALEAYSKYSQNVQKAIEENRYDAMTDQKAMYDALGKSDKNYEQAKQIVDIYKKENLKDANYVNWRKEQAENGKSYISYDAASKEYVQAKKEYDESSGWEAVGKWFNKEFARSSVIDAQYKDNWNNADGFWNKLGSVFTTVVSAVRDEDDIQRQYELRNKYGIKDGLISNDNQPMAIAASNITQIHDGTVKLAQSDPKDSAIFAKSGGPFDTLFNDIFSKVNNIYNEMSFNQPSTNYAKRISNVHSIVNGGDRFSSMTNHYDPFTASYETFNQPSTNYAKRINDIYNNTSESYVMAKPIESNFENVLQSDSIKENALYTGSTQSMYGNNRDYLNNGKETIDVNIHGELNLKSNGQSIDIMKELENDPILVRRITNMITEAVSKRVNGGRAIFNGV